VPVVRPPTNDVDDVGNVVHVVETSGNCADKRRVIAAAAAALVLFGDNASDVDCMTDDVDDDDVVGCCWPARNDARKSESNWSSDTYA
jgi:hypothetical protein